MNIFIAKYVSNISRALFLQNFYSTFPCFQIIQKRYYFFFTILLEIPRNVNYKFPFIENTFYLDPYLDPKRFRYVSIVVNLYSRDISQRCAALSTSVLTVENVADWIHYQKDFFQKGGDSELKFFVQLTPLRFEISSSFPR